MNYQTASDKLTGRCKDSRKVANNTSLVRRGDDIALRLHETDIVTFRHDGSTVLNSGGWKTVTTKARISEHYRISSVSGVWYMQDGSLFYDGVTVSPSGEVVYPRGGKDYETRLKALKKTIRAYAKAFQVNSKDIPLPSSGDCWGCLFQTADNDPAHQIEPFGTGHYFQHIEESYYVPSLLFNAIKAKRYSNSAFIYSLCQTARGWDVNKMVYDFVLGQLQSELDKEFGLIV